MFTGLPLWLNIAIFAAAAMVVWLAGARLSGSVDGIAQRTGIGHAFAGMLLLGGITSLPEMAVLASAASAGNAALTLNDLFGSVVFNLLLIAIADATIGRDALTSIISHPSTLLQGTLGVIALSLAATAIATGDIAVLGLGAWAVALLLFSVGSFWLSFGYGGRARWAISEEGEGTAKPMAPARPKAARPQGSVRSLIAATVLSAAVILGAGYALAMSADAIAHETGIASGVIGFVFLSAATSLPEVSTIITAARLRRYEMAIGDVFGTNLFNLGLIAIADIFYADGPILNRAGAFEIVAILLGIVLTGLFLVGLLEHRNRSVLRMGYDSLAAILVYLGGVALLLFAI